LPEPTGLPAGRRGSGVADWPAGMREQHRIDRARIADEHVTPDE
jgi:hypothetical protein